MMKRTDKVTIEQAAEGRKVAFEIGELFDNYIIECRRTGKHAESFFEWSKQFESSAALGAAVVGAGA